MRLMLPLAVNLLIVIGVSVIGSSLVLASQRKSSDWLWGLVFGAGTVLSMAAAVSTFQGLVLDFRSIILALAGYTGGLVTVALVTLISVAFRLWQGGEASWVGVLTIVAYAAGGLYFRWQRKTLHPPSTRALLGLGLYLSLAKILSIFIAAMFLPGGWVALSFIDLSSLLLTPIGALIVFKSFFALRRQVTRLVTLEAALAALPTSLLVRENPREWLCLNQEASADLWVGEAVLELEASPWGLVGDRQGNSMTSSGQVEYHWQSMDFHTSQGRTTKLLALDDITSVKLTSRQLDHFFELSPDAMLIITASGAVERANIVWQEMLGAWRVDRVQATLWDLLDPEGAVFGRDDLAKLGERGGQYACLIDIKKPGLPSRSFSASFVAQAGEKSIYATLRDVTLAKQEEAQLSVQARELFEQAELLEAVHDAIVVYDPQGKIEYWNRGAERIYGWQRHEVLRVRRGTIFSRSEEEDQLVERGLSEDGYWRGDLIRQRRDGTPIVVECGRVIHRDAARQGAGTLEVSRDVTVRRENSLAESKLAALVVQSSNAIVSTTLSGQILTWNKAATEILGYQEGEIKGKSFIDILGGDTEEWAAIYSQVTIGQHVGAVKTELLHRNGSCLRALVTISPLAETDKSLDGVVLIIRDRSIAENLAKDFARLDRLNHVAQLARGIAHELRNPLTTARGFLQIYAARPELAMYGARFELLLSEMDRMNDLLNEVVTLSGTRHVQLESRQLNSIVEAVWPSLQGEAKTEEKSVLLDLGAVPDIFLSEKELRALVTNLVRNALEASPPGGTVAVRTIAVAEGVVLSVEDSGTGISKENREHIGTPFFTTKKYGTGMGLAICYAVAKEHRATISFSSDSSGTVFRVVFPLSSSH
ncbi:MAG: Sporulation kinase E [Firmicutes bacterium]|nr:Sporulation kinase E [Bacillota bacterium]